jgi:hypothetical protein
MQQLINEMSEKYNLSHTIKQEIEILVALAKIKGQNEQSNFNNNSSTNLCQLCRQSQRN